MIKKSKHKLNFFERLTDPMRFGIVGSPPEKIFNFIWYFCSQELLPMWPQIRSLIRYMVGIWSKFGQGRKLVKKVKIWKVLRMGLPIVENLSGLQESIFSLSRSPQLHFGKKSKNGRNL